MRKVSLVGSLYFVKNVYLTVYTNLRLSSGMIAFEKYTLIWKLLPKSYHPYNRDSTHPVPAWFSWEKLFICKCLAYSSVCAYRPRQICMLQDILEGLTFYEINWIKDFEFNFELKIKYLTHFALTSCKWNCLSLLMKDTTFQNMH